MDARPRPSRQARQQPELIKFANLLESTIIKTVEAGYMTKDLALLIGAEQKWMTTVAFLDKIDERFQKAMAA